MNFEYIYWISHTFRLTKTHMQTESDRIGRWRERRGRDDVLDLFNTSKDLLHTKRKRAIKRRTSACYLSISGNVCVVAINSNRAYPLCNGWSDRKWRCSYARDIYTYFLVRVVCLESGFFTSNARPLSLCHTLTRIAFCISLSHCSAWFIEKVAIECGVYTLPYSKQLDAFGAGGPLIKT